MVVAAIGSRDQLVRQIPHIDTGGAIDVLFMFSTMGTKSCSFSRCWSARPYSYRPI